jgi:hypothetical protein
MGKVMRFVMSSRGHWKYCQLISETASLTDPTISAEVPGPRNTKHADAQSTQSNQSKQTNNENGHQTRFLASVPSNLNRSLDTMQWCSTM